ncbi:hypothetical protein FGO68_gene2793 [Halteria grandinella]|uniref:Brl1/Brr6 domain-containing protein n=1 Tax=Halteria grandinella TaxID=5974 RepID=A0A8J8NHX9_HALGN|nr:hypothetical protein FGO68_gene2793 [Halteria grandinella]
MEVKQEEKLLERKQEQVIKRGPEDAIINFEQPILERLPRTLVIYGWACFILLILAVSGFTIVSVFQSVQRDVNKKYEAELSVVRQKIDQCSMQYLSNKCSQPVPALKDQCLQLELCMNTHSADSATYDSLIVARLTGQVINEFFDHLSWKAMLFLVGITLVTIMAMWKVLQKH